MDRRLDAFLVEKGYVPSREKAKELIRKGQVYVDGQQADKPSRKLSGESAPSIEIRGDLLSFVSRGGLKLAKALESFPIDLKGRVCMDVGASTGGFTDCMLKNGAAKVYAVDVGTGQLAPSLRTDSRVICMEQTNMRYLKAEDLGEKMDFISIDVSFISLEKILPPAAACLKEGGEMVCLVKPQFEAGRGKVTKKGVIKDLGLRRRVLAEVMDFAGHLSLYPSGLTGSPIRGPEGNVEFLLHLIHDKDGEERGSPIFDEDAISRVVEESDRI